MPIGGRRAARDGPSCDSTSGFSHHTCRRQASEDGVSTTIAEIAEGIYRVSTYTDEIPGGFTFNQFLIDADEPLLFHCGLRGAFPAIAEAVASVRPVPTLRWLSFGHWEADESGAMNQWLAAAPHATVTVGTLGEMISGS